MLVCLYGLDVIQFSYIVIYGRIKEENNNTTDLHYSLLEWQEKIQHENLYIIVSMILRWENLS